VLPGNGIGRSERTDLDSNYTPDDNDCFESSSKIKSHLKVSTIASLFTIRMALYTLLRGLTSSSWHSTNSTHPHFNGTNRVFLYLFPIH